MTHALAVVAALLVASTAYAAEPGPTPAPDRATHPCAPLPRGQKVLVDLRDAPLSDVARLVSCALSRDVLFSPATLENKRVTVISAVPVDRRGLRQLWRALLESHELVAEPHGAYEIVRPVRR